MKSYSTIEDAKKDYKFLREKPIGTRIFIETTQLYYTLTGERKEPIFDNGKIKMEATHKYFEVDTNIRPN